MSKNNTVETIEARFNFFPTAWPAGVAREVFELLIGQDKLFPASRWGNEGNYFLPAESEDMIDWLTERYEASHKANGITLFTNKIMKDGFYFSLYRSEWHEDSKIGHLLHWPKNLDLTIPFEHDSIDESLKVINMIAALTEAPLVTIDYRKSVKHEPITLAATREHKRVVQGTIHGNASAGPWRGLHRIPWQLIMGQHIVATIGVDKLKKLFRYNAIDHGNGLWTLQTTVDPADSILDMGREAEREIIETLGQQFFSQTDQNKLAKVPPKFPDELVPKDSRLFERYGESRLKPL